jgi:hypothetical protein
MKFIKVFLFPLLILMVFFGCRKESFTSNPTSHLRASVDSLHFDTVFTTTGSTSQVIKIFNDNKRSIHIGSVKLAGGINSPFKINVDGSAGPEVDNIDIASEDSLYIFVTVTIDPSAANLPFIVRDSIAISYNGNTDYVQLDAYGQNAHFYKNRIIKTNETWINDLPYVILGGITVDTNATLTINKSVRIFMHADAPFFVNGTLHAAGEKWDSTRIVFTGDRLDEPYRDYPAAWPGMIFTNSSTGNLLDYVVVKNAYQGITVSGSSSIPKLSMHQCIVDNAYDIGLGAINTNIVAENLLISNCGKDLVLLKGGSYDFKHATVTSYSNALVQHRDPVCIITNYLTENGTTSTNPLSANFTNCIFWGEENGVVNDEVVVLKQGANPFNINFQNVLWRVHTQPSVVQGVSVSAAINNIDPSFDSVNNFKRFYSFRLKQSSPAVNKGAATTVNLDLDGLPRPAGLPDIGAYEKQ